MIPKNTTVPTAKTQIFSTAADNQPSVEVHVLQGERPMAADNKTLARFILDGIPPSPRGVPQVEVSFDIDANGILNVKAIDKATGKSQSVKIEAQTSLSKEEIERLKNEAAVHADSDKKKKDLIEAKNQGEALAYSAEKAVKDAGDKLDSSIKSEVEEKISTLRSALGSEEKEKIDSASEDLSASLQKIGESLYNEGKEPEQNNEENKGGENKGEGGKEGKEE
ncbi:MAG: Hsp70 family protein, partial [Candidatus Colwellbacteria bacterium]|nr:Hsp70 family protein [Candidatus Colwellbacteria bacterium]